MRTPVVVALIVLASVAVKATAGSRELLQYRNLLQGDTAYRCVNTVHRLLAGSSLYLAA